MTTTTLTDDLSQFIGTEHYYVSPLYRWMRYTDGVKYFCEKAGAYWFLDVIGTEMKPITARNSFIDIILDVKDGAAKITASNGNNRVLWQRGVDFTDCPPGEYKFFLQNGVFFLQSEY